MRIFLAITFAATVTASGPYCSETTRCEGDRHTTASCNNNQNKCGNNKCKGIWCDPSESYCNWNGCNGNPEGGDWCNKNIKRCEKRCKGTWCNPANPPTTPCCSQTATQCVNWCGSHYKEKSCNKCNDQLFWLDQGLPQQPCVGNWDDCTDYYNGVAGSVGCCTPLTCKGDNEYAQCLYIP